MTQEEKLQIAMAYGIDHGYDIVTAVGIRDGYAYFDITNTSLIGRKTGLPHILKINDSGQIVETRSLPEVMWAIHQMKEAKK